jgi:hypothetical protein
MVPLFPQKIILVLILTSIIFAIGCKTQRSYPAKYDGTQIKFGQGGGFTGLKTEYAILENGDCFKKSAGKDTFKYYVRFDKTYVDQMLYNFDFLGLREIEMHAPGDLYFFIELTEGDNMKKLVWGKSDVETSESLKSFYRILYTSVKKELK